MPVFAEETAKGQEMTLEGPANLIEVSRTEETLEIGVSGETESFVKISSPGSAVGDETAMVFDYHNGTYSGTWTMTQ